MFDWDKIIIDVDDNAVDLTAGEVSLLVGADADTVTWGNLTGDITQQADLMLELDSKIGVDSPESTGTPRTPTPPAWNSSTRIANTKFVKEAIDAVVPVGGFGTLASKDTVDYRTEVTHKPTLGNLASKNKVDYDTDINNTPELGALASKDTVSYETEVTNKPAFGTLALKDSVDHLTEVTSKPRLGDLASKNYVDYESDVLNKPNFGSLALKNSVDWDTEVYHKPDVESLAKKSLIADEKSVDTGTVYPGDYFIYSDKLYRADDTNTSGSPTSVSSIVKLADDVKSSLEKWAPRFSTSAKYGVGSYIYHNTDLTRFIYNHNAAAWDNFDVVATNLAKEISTSELLIQAETSDPSAPTYTSADAEIRAAGAHAITKIDMNYSSSGTISETVKTIVISGHKRITVRAIGGNKITFNGLYGSQYHLDNTFYSIIVEDGAILELEGNISVTHANSNGILVRRGGMVIYRSVNGSVLNISLPSENYHDGILVETGGKFIAEGNIVATRGSTIYQEYPSHVINVSYGAEAHVKGITATNFNYCIGCTGGLASYESISGAGVFTASGGRVFTGAQ